MGVSETLLSRIIQLRSPLPLSYHTSGILQVRRCISPLSPSPLSPSPLSPSPLSPLSLLTFSAVLDPSYSVLLGDKTYEDVCSSHIAKSNKKTLKLVTIIVPIVVGLLLLAALSVVLYPKYYPLLSFSLFQFIFC